MKSPLEIVRQAIEEWKPRKIVCLFSGGYDSMCMTHLVHTFQIPVATWAINTQLSADGWTEYVTDVAKELGFSDFHIQENTKGYKQYVKWVQEYGCPRNLSGHSRAYARLKERGIDAIHMHYKQQRSDKTLFLSGMRKHESDYRNRIMHEPIQRHGNSNKIFANPLFHWTDEDIARYRIENDLPDNPFYSTVKGSGDCQCNWGNFITLGTLQIHSPALAAGRVADLDRISKQQHGYGWDGQPDIEPLFDTDEYLGQKQATTPFLCSNCSRAGGHKHQVAEEVMLQRGIF